MLRQDIFHMCVQNLKRRKSRTFLTVLGVLIGCCSIVIMVSLGIGMNEASEKMLKEMGDLTIVTVTAPRDGRGKAKLDDAAVAALPGRIRTAMNRRMPAYSRLSDVERNPSPFEKTPKMSIKRFLYR